MGTYEYSQNNDSIQKAFEDVRLIRESALLDNNYIVKWNNKPFFPDHNLRITQLYTARIFLSDDFE